MANRKKFKDFSNVDALMEDEMGRKRRSKVKQGSDDPDSHASKKKRKQSRLEKKQKRQKRQKRTERDYFADDNVPE